MKKCFCLILVLLLILSGCSYAKMETECEKDGESVTSMFVMVEAAYSWMIVYHKDTKVMYAVSYGGSNAGTFTLLVNQDGTPMIWGGNS